MPDNSLAQMAINLTLFHWGIHGWIVYSIIGVTLGVVTYRKGLPMTMKSCFWPLIGDKVFGWIGDAVDILSIFTTLFGVCTALGIGAIQLNQGLHLLNSSIPITTNTQVIIIWLVSFIATISALSGIGFGIRRLSEICFGLGSTILGSVFLLEDPFYLFNLFVQSIGYYFQNLLQLSWHTDAFEMSGTSFGGFERGRAFKDGESDGPPLWMDGWTMFYWGFWISWSPFVGMFLAKVSKGRTIREFINGTMTAPVAFCFIWFCTFGGSGLRMERHAAGLGLCCDHHLNLTTVAATSNATSNDVIMPHLLDKRLCHVNPDGYSTCDACSVAFWNRFSSSHWRMRSVDIQAKSGYLKIQYDIRH